MAMPRVKIPLDVQFIRWAIPALSRRSRAGLSMRAVSEALAQMENVDFIEDKNSIRLEVRRLMEELLAQEARIDASARQKIESQKRTIIEGSAEWDIMYRKYYNDEVKKLGI